MTQRRAVLGAIAGCWTAWPLESRGVPKVKVHRVGTICAGGGGIDYFWKQFRALGYEEHRNVEYVLKDVDATGDLPGHAAKLVGASVDVIVACSNDEAQGGGAGDLADSDRSPLWRRAGGDRARRVAGKAGRQPHRLGGDLDRPREQVDRGLQERGADASDFFRSSST